MDADGSNKIRLTNNGAANFCPFFHPSGRKIIFSSNLEDPKGRNFDIFMIDLDGKNLERVTFDGSFDGFPMFSPDGRKLAFCSNREASERVKRISSSRSGETSSTRNAGWPIPGLGERGGSLWAALIAASALLTFDPKLYVNGDNIDYMNLAKAVRDGDLWQSPKYPPLFPWLLAIPQSVFGLALLPQKALVTLLFLGSGILLMRRARTLFGTPWGEPIAWIGITLVPFSNSATT